MSTEFDTLAGEYWASPPYDDHVHDESVHAFDTIQDLLLDADDAELSALLRALARSAPTARDLAYVGATWVVGLEYRFDAEGDTGRSIAVLAAAGLDADLVVGILAGIAPDWLSAMGAPARLDGVLQPAQIAWLVNADAEGRSVCL